jgi:hypothetical protein
VGAVAIQTTTTCELSAAQDKKTAHSITSSNKESILAANLFHLQLLPQVVQWQHIQTRQNVQENEREQ